MSVSSSGNEAPAQLHLKIQNWARSTSSQGHIDFRSTKSQGQFLQSISGQQPVESIFTFLLCWQLPLSSLGFHPSDRKTPNVNHNFYCSKFQNDPAVLSHKKQTGHHPLKEAEWASPAHSLKPLFKHLVHNLRLDFWQNKPAILCAKQI